MRPYFPKTWNDILAVILLIGIPCIWLFKNVEGEVNGALIAAFMLVVQFYFRKSKTEK